MWGEADLQLPSEGGRRAGPATLLHGKRFFRAESSATRTPQDNGGHCPDVFVAYPGQPSPSSPRRAG